MIGIGLALILFLAVNLLAGALLDRHPARPDRGPPVHAVGRHPRGAGRRSRSRSICASTTAEQLDALGPYFSGHAQRVDELLSAYRQLSGGKVRVERLDPEPFSPEEDLAVAEGLEGLPISDDGTLAYFGLSGRNSTDDLEVIPYLAPERANFLEYDLTRMIGDLAQPEKPVVAVLGDLPLMGGQINRFQPWKVLEAMYQFFDVRFLGGKQDRIDDDVEVLMLAQPHNVDPATLYAIDQFVMRGGRVLAFVDPLAEAMAAGGGMNPMADPEGDAVAALEPLLAAWGVAIADGMVIGDQAAAQRVTARIGGRQVVVDYLPWLASARTSSPRNDVVTGELRRINLNSAGSIHAREGATHHDRAADGLEPGSRWRSTPTTIRLDPDPAKLIADFSPAGESFTLAARITGPVKSAYPDGPPEGVEAQGEHLAEAKAAAQPDPGRRCRPAGRCDLGAPAGPARPADRGADRQQRRLRDQRARQPGRQPGADQPARARPGRPPVRGRARDGARGRAAVPRQGAGAARPRSTRPQGKIRQLQDEEQQSGVILTAAQQAGDRELPRRDDHAAPGAARRCSARCARTSRASRPGSRSSTSGRCRCWSRWSRSASRCGATRGPRAARRRPAEPHPTEELPA